MDLVSVCLISLRVRCGLQPSSANFGSSEKMQSSTRLRVRWDLGVADKCVMAARRPTDEYILAEERKGPGRGFQGGRDVESKLKVEKDGREQAASWRRSRNRHRVQSNPARSDRRSD